MKLKTVALGILLSFTCPVLRAQSPPADPLAENLFPPELVLQHQSDIGLTEEQRNALIAEGQKAQERFSDLQQRLQKEVEALVVMNINTMTFVAPNLACGEARGGRIPQSGAVTDEQRRHRPNSAQPSGRQFFSGQTSLLAPHRSTSGYARRSRLVWPKNPLPRTSSY